MSRKRTFFGESLATNMLTYNQYFMQLTEIAISRFKWLNLPASVDSRYIEKTLFQSGSAVYFNDEYLGDLCLNVITQGSFNVYGYPIKRRAYSNYNNYQKELDDKNSVIIFNNYMRTNSLTQVINFSKRLYNLDRIIDVNANAQKTPILLMGTEKQRLSLLNLYKEYDGNAPVIHGDKNLDLNGIKCIQTNAPYISDKIYSLKVNIWNEALTYLGISNITIEKRERLISDEVMRNQGGTIANRYSALKSRQEAAEKINQMFNTNISVEFQEDYSDIVSENNIEVSYNE